jgi:hypothetical protein
MAVESVKLSRFQKLMRLASGLPWSDKERIYDALSRTLLEHVLMTSILSQLHEYRTDDPAHLKLAVDRLLEEVGERSRGVLHQRGHLVDLYIDALLAPAATAEGSFPGPKCEWVAGCPATALTGIALPAGLRRLSRLEVDHVFPKARLPSDFGQNSFQTLCSYHNQECKRAHIAFALDDTWFQ